jgi:hypothetical protein
MSKVFTEKDFRVKMNVPEIKIGMACKYYQQEGIIYNIEEDWIFIQLNQPDRYGNTVYKVHKDGFNFMTQE